MKLAEQTCKPIPAGTLPLLPKEAEALQLMTPLWALGEKELVQVFRFKDFRLAMDFVNKAAALANEQDHHPDIFISYNKVKLTFSTHKIGGLSMNDFIMAAKIDLMNEGLRSEKAA